MVAIRVNAVITDDGQLIVKLPKGIPPGAVEIVIQAPDVVTASPAREAARAKLAAAGKLSVSPSVQSYSPVEKPPFVLPPGARSSEELVSEDRDE
jgi:hypothetical protein